MGFSCRTYSRATCACNRTPCSSSPMPSVHQSRQSKGKLFGGERFMKGASGLPSHNMKKIRVPKKDNVVAVLGHKGTFQVLSVDSRNRVVDLRSLERDICLQRCWRGFLGHHSCICHSPKNLRAGSSVTAVGLQSTKSTMIRIRRTPWSIDIRDEHF